MRKLALFLLLIGFSQGPTAGQTLLPIRCTSIQAPGVLLSVFLPGSINGIVLGLPTCVQLDSNFTLDKTTTPPTVRLGPLTSPRTPVNEVPTGSVNGINATFTLSATPAASFPVMVWRNGILLTACGPLVGNATCNGDYQVTGSTITFLAATQTAVGVSAVPLAADLIQALYWK